MFELYSVPSHEHGTPEITPGRAIGSNKRTVEPGTVLLCKINPRINRVWMTGAHSDHPKIASTEWIPFFPLTQIEPRYLAWFLRQDIVRDYAAGNASGVGGSLMRVRAETFRDFRFPLAPANEQAQIADTIDALFSGVDAGVAALKRARERLRLYRSSLLKAAVEGSLTAEWRLRNPDLEPGAEFLKRILVERRKRWEQDQMRKFQEKGKTPPKNWRARYKEPVEPDTTDLPPLPEGWCWTNLDTLSVYGPQNGLYLPSTKYGDGTEILRIEDFQINWVRRRNELKQVAAEQDDVETFGLQVGDLVINRVNSLTHLGKCVVITDQLKGVLFESNMMRTKLTHRCSPNYLRYYLNSQPGRNRLTSGAKWAVNQASINQQDVRRTLVPLPPLREQGIITEILDTQFSGMEHLESDIYDKLETTQALRQAILNHAFNGKLVPQDPKDKPASKLLALITTERKARERETAVARRAGKTRNNLSQRRGSPDSNKNRTLPARVGKP